MANRDHTRYRLRDKRQVTMSTSFGEISFSRRLYQDREKGTYVYLLDQALAFDGQTGISPHLEEWAVELATAGPSYHESARQIKELLGYQAISHETVQQRSSPDQVSGFCRNGSKGGKGIVRGSRRLVYKASTVETPRERKQDRDHP